ncbi:MAG: glycine--tRNA ligase subunit beta [Gammaproteobacteria bacterium]|nr:MAG: glycine--tRNA ligase subunit beta [Gammaproteobacteria bacterium]
MKQDDFLVEIHTEELPPKALRKLGEAFSQQLQERLQKSDLSFAALHYFATPRRLAVLVKDLVAAQPDQVIERKGPALTAAFDAEGKPTPACVGFARSCGVTPVELITLKNAQGEWVGLQQKVAGKPMHELMPTLVEQALAALPIPKRMRWSEGETQFVRPVHSVIMLYGDQIIDATILGCRTNRVTRGHRFLAPGWMTIPTAAAYASLLETEGKVIVDFAKRREEILHQAKKKLTNQAEMVYDDELLDEVTGLVEWPTALYGSFDEKFLQLPQEVLISAMRDHQRYFPVKNATLTPHFITISNIDSVDPARVIHGNERVLRARLSDAAFFYETDQKESLEQRTERLKGMVYQAKLGTLYDKVERLSKLMGNDRAGLLAKSDLTTNMVGEFPELQGIMGGYYALHDGEPAEIAQAIAEQYLPRFAGDKLPASSLGQRLAMMDRIDTLVGAFSINQIPTGDKDPYGLRRAALGVLRILIEKEIDLDLNELLHKALALYHSENKETVEQVLNFMQERLRSWYQEQGITADVFAAVAAVGITNPLDAHKRIQAVQAFKQLSAAEALSTANKRVSNILSKYEGKLDSQAINPQLFEEAAEKELAKQLEAKSEVVTRLSQAGQYDEVLLTLAELREPIDNFFDHVMVMSDDKAQRENRILLLHQLRSLFLQVADIALLVIY